MSMEKTFQPEQLGKIFVVIGTSALGDVMICNSLVQNIKNIYPDSKVVFIANKTYQDIARYQKGVDEVFVYDKKGIHKGLFGMIKFIRSFPYRNANYAIMTYVNERSWILSKFIAKKTLYIRKKDSNLSMQEYRSSVLKQITDKEIINYPVEFEVENKIPEKFSNIIDTSKKNIIFCPVSTSPKRDLPINMAVELINNLNSQGYNVIFTGAGNKSKEYANTLKQNNCDFINLVNGTTIVELGQILKSIGILISVDTGTMHLGYAVGAKTICIFLEPPPHKSWAPSEKIYKHTKTFQNPTMKEITDYINKSNI